MTASDDPDHAADVLPYVVNFHRSCPANFLQHYPPDWKGMPLEINVMVEANLDDVANWILCGEVIPTLSDANAKRTGKEASLGNKEPATGHKKLNTP